MKKKKKRGPARASAAAPAPPSALKSRIQNLEALKIPYIIALCAALFLGWWRMSSRPLTAIIGTAPVTAVSATLSQRLIIDGEYKTYNWMLYADSSPDLDAVMEILETKRFRPDFRNLWQSQPASMPYSVTGIDSYLTLSREGGDGQSVSLTIHRPFSGRETVYVGNKRFYTVNEISAQLMTYMERHGEPFSMDGIADMLEEAASGPDSSATPDAPGSSDAR